MIKPALFVDCYSYKTWAQRDLDKNSFESKDHDLRLVMKCTALRMGELLHLTSRTEDGQNKTVKEEKGRGNLQALSTDHSPQSTASSP
jgi:hypothetical protein